MVQGRPWLGAGVKGMVSQAFAVSVSFPLFCLVIGAQLVFLTSPQVMREGRFSYEYPKESSSECGKENVEEIKWECYQLLEEV